MVACTVVMAIHVVMTWIVTRPTEGAPGTASSDLQLVFIQPINARSRPVERQAPPPAVTRRQVASYTADSAHILHRQGAEQQPAVTARAHQAPIPVVANDEWEPSAKKPAEDGITFSRNVLANTYDPRPHPVPGRFRMKREITPEAVVRGVAQIVGFWPPGYTDDPCGGLKKTVEIFMSNRTPRTDAQLADALLQRDMYCR